MAETQEARAEALQALRAACSAAEAQIRATKTGETPYVLWALPVTFFEVAFDKPKGSLNGVITQLCHITARQIQDWLEQYPDIPPRQRTQVTTAFFWDTLEATLRAPQEIWEDRLRGEADLKAAESSADRVAEFASSLEDALKRLGLSEATILEEICAREAELPTIPDTVCEARISYDQVRRVSRARLQFLKGTPESRFRYKVMRGSRTVLV